MYSRLIAEGTETVTKLNTRTHLIAGATSEFPTIQELSSDIEMFFRHIAQKAGSYGNSKVVGRR